MLGVSAIVENSIHNFGDLTSLIGCSVDIEDCDRIGELASGEPFLSDKVMVNEGTSGSRIKQGTSGEVLCSVQGLKVDLKEEGSASSIKSRDCWTKGKVAFPLRLWQRWRWGWRWQIC
jgi:hypothetical protein